MNERVFGVAVAGTGIMGRRMLAALQAHPRFRVVNLWDPDANATEQALRASPQARVARDLATLVADPEVDLVYVASPPATHLPCVRAALAVGRACLCEKPLAANVREAEALRDLVVATGPPLAINFPFASAPAARALVELVAAARSVKSAARRSSSAPHGGRVRGRPPRAAGSPARPKADSRARCCRTSCSSVLSRK